MTRFLRHINAVHRHLAVLRFDGVVISMATDKPPKKDDKTKSEENAKAASVLDNILGGDLGFGADDLSLDLGMDLDNILNTEISGLAKTETKGALDDLISGPSTPATPAVTESTEKPDEEKDEAQDATATAPSESADASADTAATEAVATETTATEDAAPTVAETAPKTEDAAPSEAASTEESNAKAAEPTPADNDAPTAVASNDEADAKAAEPTAENEPTTVEAASADPQEPAAATETSEPSASTAEETPTPTVEATDTTSADDTSDNVAEDEVKEAAPAVAVQADDETNLDKSEPSAVEETPVDAQEAQASTDPTTEESPRETPVVEETPAAEVAEATATEETPEKEAEEQTTPLSIGDEESQPTTIELTADAIEEDDEEDKPKNKSAGLTINATQAKSTTIELNEADEILEELRELHAKNIEGAPAKAPPPPPPSRPKGPPPPPKKAAAVPPPPPASRATPPPPPETYLREKDSGPTTMELDLVDAVVEVSPDADENAIPRIKAKALEEAPIEVDVSDAPAAELPPPPGDLKELLDVPNTTMPSPPEKLEHEVELPEAELPPPPDSLEGLMGAPEPQLEPPPEDLKAAVENDVAAERDAQEAEAAQASKDGLFPGVDSPDTPEATNNKAQESDESALADAVSSSKTELAAIIGSPATSEPAPEAPTSEAAPESPTPQATGGANTTQLLGPDFAESLQKELHKMSPANGEAKPNAAANDIEFPPKEAAPPTSGTADFLDAETDSAPSDPTPSPTSKPKKSANPLMQTAMYGSDMAELQQQLAEAQKAADAKEEAEAAKSNEEAAPTPPSETGGKQKGTAFQTQLYTAEDVSQAAAKIALTQGEGANKATVVEMAPATPPDEEEKVGVKVQLDQSAKSFKSDLPADSLFDVNMDAEIEAHVAARKQEAEAEQAIKQQNFAAAIRIYHELQQKFPDEARFREKLKQLVALEKKSKGAPASKPAPVATATATPMAPSNAQARPAKPMIQSARKATPPKQGMSTLNIVLAALVLLLSLTLFTGLVWPGWLRSKPTAPAKKPNKIAPIVPAER